ncbi:hypothetical protein BGZ67_005942 [Mortierella alpina]|nr:hypothetical protein BGZ67_005942 [Mortierella alpina]
MAADNKPTTPSADAASADTTSAHSASNHGNSNSSRSIFSVTVDPNALEQELDQAAQALHSTVNSLLNTMQSSVFGGLETLSREMSALEQTSKSFLEDHHPYHAVQSRFPWSLRTDGPKKRYRITIEELPPLEDAGAKKVLTTTTASGTVSDGEDFTITQGKAGTADEGKTVITASVAPGLLDWLLFTTHEDSFFRRLGHQQQQQQSETTDYDMVGGTRIHELKDEREEPLQEVAKKRVVPALVEKVKQVGTNWEKDARQWWHSKAQRSEEARRGRETEELDNEFLDRQHHLFTGVRAQNDRDQDEERHSRRWPRGESWARSESYSQTTVTRPDGTVEHRTVNSVNGETETVVKIQHPDGSVEETVTHHQDSDPSRQNSHRHGRQHDDQYGGFRDRWAHRRQNQYLYEGEEDRERDAVAAVVAEAIAAEKEAEAEEYQQQQQQQQGKSRSWPPKAWTRRQERD